MYIYVYIYISLWHVLLELRAEPFQYSPCPPCCHSHLGCRASLQLAPNGNSNSDNSATFTPWLAINHLHPAAEKSQCSVPQRLLILNRPCLRKIWCNLPESWWEIVHLNLLGASILNNTCYPDRFSRCLAPDILCFQDTTTKLSAEIGVIVRSQDSFVQPLLKVCLSVRAP